MANTNPPAQASACPVCGGRINSLTGHCHATHVIEGTRLSDGTFAPTTAYHHVPLTTGASLEPERPNFSGWTEEKPSESAPLPTKDELKRHMREQAAADEAREKLRKQTIEVASRMSGENAARFAFDNAWDAALEWARKNGGGV